jgi:hypothetical protein
VDVVVKIKYLYTHAGNRTAVAQSSGSQTCPLLTVVKKPVGFRGPVPHTSDTVLITVYIQNITEISKHIYLQQKVIW